jgi:hypothetical protein
MNTKAKVMKLEALIAAKNGTEMKILIREEDESDENCINRSQYKDSSRINLIVISKTDARL